MGEFILIMGLTLGGYAHAQETLPDLSGLLPSAGEVMGLKLVDGANNLSPWSEVRKFTVGAPTWTNFAASSLTPNGVVGGSTVQGKVHIQNVAPAGGQVYTLTSSNPAAASVPPSVTVPAGASSATFTVTTDRKSVV